MAVLDPKREDCHYPFDDLSGCGVGFKLVQAYAQKYDIPFEKVSPLLDLLVVSIASDLVSVTGENRVLAFYGLKQLNENPRKGLMSVIKLSGLEKHNITIDEIVFKIGPRINAAGRMESGRTAVDMLTAQQLADGPEIGIQRLDALFLPDQDVGGPDLPGDGIRFVGPFEGLQFERSGDVDRIVTLTEDPPRLFKVRRIDQIVGPLRIGGAEHRGAEAVGDRMPDKTEAFHCRLLCRTASKQRIAAETETLRESIRPAIGIRMCAS